MEKNHHFSWHSGMPDMANKFGSHRAHERHIFGPHLRHERRDAAEHRQLILEVAQHLFAEQGVDAVSMHQIAMAAGIGQGTLYRRYAHKGELCMDLMRERYERFAEEVEGLIEANATSSALERLDLILAHIVAFLEEHGALLGPVAAPDMRYAPCSEADKSRQFSFQQESFYPWLHQLFTELLAEAVEQGDLVSLDVPYTSDAILSVLHPMFYRFQRQERGFSPERILQGLHRIYIDGVKTPNTGNLEVSLRE